MIDTQHIVRAVASHATWKYRLRQAIKTGTSEWTVSTVQVDDQCDFGRWLRSLPPTEQQRDHWKTVSARHREFHRAAADVLREGLTFGVSDEAAAGVTVRLLEEDVEIELTDETVTALLMEYMLPRFRAILEQGA